MKEPLSPCQNCKNRCLGCHSQCQQYITFKQDHERYVRLVRKNKEDVWSLDMVEKKRFEKYVKIKNKQR